MAEAAPDSTNSAQPDSVDVLNVNVGVLGHVDSGKTSLVKALSTLLSTAALDKSKQSRARGMTLDLGFSCFFLDMPAHLKEHFPDKSNLQITLVDCPGHASLIRTIIGGAQIIDMVLLVVDAFKGWQAQTTECLVLAELTSPHLVVALNKADLFKPEERESQLVLAEKKVRERLAHTRFASAPVVPVAACVGGEKVAALETSGSNETFNVDLLVKTLKNKLPPPQRSSTGPFYFSVDHCFALRGRGTVLTGTVLSGKISVNDVLEFPALALDRKVKSMQMFKRQVAMIQQGDRAGICVSNFDAKLLERGIAASPGAVQLWKGAIALIRKVPYYPGTLPCGMKFHISVGHTTVMATVTFWGARELSRKNHTATGVAAAAADTTDKSITATNSKVGDKKGSALVAVSSLGGGADTAGLPKYEYDFNEIFIHQDELLETLADPAIAAAESTEASKTKKKATVEDPLLHWAMFDFQIPVFCLANSLAIGSRLDTVDNASGSVSSCRLAFSARMIQKIDPESDSQRLRIYTPKEKRGVITRLGDAYKRTDDGCIVRYEVFGSDLFKKETNMKLFIGMKLETEKGEVGEIKSSFGTTGKFRAFFPAGTEAREGDPLIMRFKRFAHDIKKEMHQDVELPSARSGSQLNKSKPKSKKEEKLPEGVKRFGEVVSFKGDVLANGKQNMAIIGGFFAPEINIKERAGVKVRIPSTGEEGAIIGPFGKAGKCKVSFENGVSAEVGAKAELKL